MNFRAAHYLTILTLTAVLFGAACEPQPMSTNSNANTGNTNTVANSQPASNANTSATSEKQAASQPVTLPVLDAMFADANFAAELKSKLSLTDDQIEKLKQAARETTAGLRETEEGSTAAARRRADEQIRAIIGAEKAAELARFVSERWSGGEAQNAATDQKMNSVPTDTRIVVNAPAFRMDLFKDGQLVRTYKVGIGYPEFPLPTGMRKAGEIIFNPTWTPPDEPWVESPTSKVKVGEKVEAGSPLNPLGPIKIPIGLPSLIHGGKSPARLGNFASHGCVGLTSPQVQDFAVALAFLTGTPLTDQDVMNYAKTKTETKNVKLQNGVPVELRYETIVVQDGKLYIYRDVYERGTNTEENLRRTLEAAGVSFDSLSEQERTKALDAIKQMSVDAGGNPVDPNQAANNSNANANSSANSNANKMAGDKNKNANQQGEKVTRSVKGKKEIVIEIAALKGKGYPAPVDLNTGGKSKKPLGQTPNNMPANTMSGAPNKPGQNQPKSDSRKF